LVKDILLYLDMNESKQTLMKLDMKMQMWESWLKAAHRK